MIIDKLEQLRRQPLPVRQQATAFFTFVAVAIITFIWFVLFFSHFVLNGFTWNVPTQKTVPSDVKTTTSGIEAPYSE